MTKIAESCQAIIAGYNAGQPGMNEPMICHLIELGDHAGLILEMRELFLVSLESWEGEEESVKYEHASLINAMKMIAERL